MDTQREPRAAEVFKASREYGDSSGQALWPSVPWTARKAATLCLLGLIASVPSPTLLAQNVDTQSVPIQAIRVSDDNGSRPCQITVEQVRQWVAYANRVYRSCDVHFAFRGERDFADLRSTVLNRMTGVQDANWREAKRLGNEVAARYPGKLVVFFRFGPGNDPAGGGFSASDYNFVAAPGFKNTSVCGRQNIHLLAHEIGHYFSLPHTFAREFDTVAEADKFVREHKGELGAFDGDGFEDTPPDPFIKLLQCGKDQFVQLNGQRVSLPRNNLMGYWHGEKTTFLSPQQQARVRWMLKLRSRHAMAMPSNVDEGRRIEAETLPVTATRDAHASPQDMDGFGVDCWSGGRQLFVGARDGGSLTLTLAVPESGDYAVLLYATRAPDYGDVRVALDGTPFERQIEGYAPLVLPTGAIELGSRTLTAGEHPLDFTIVGKAPESKGYSAGIDAVGLVPAR